MGRLLVLPEHGAVVEVGDREAPPVSGAQGRVVGRARGLLAQAGHRDPEDRGVADGLQRQVLPGQLQVGGRGLAVEVEGEVIRREDLAEGNRGVVGGLGDDVAVVDPEAAHLGAHEAPEGVVSHAGDDGGAVPVAGGGHRHIGGAPAQELAEALHVLQPDADLKGVDVDAAAPDGEHVEPVGVSGGCGRALGRDRLGHLGRCRRCCRHGDRVSTSLGAAGLRNGGLRRASLRSLPHWTAPGQAFVRTFRTRLPAQQPQDGDSA